MKTDDERRGVVRAGITRGLGAFLARYPGVSADKILKAAGLDRSIDPDELLSQRLIVDLLNTAARETGDPAFGLAYAEQLPWRDLGVLGYVLLHSPTIGAAYANTSRYFSIQSTAGHTSIVIDDDDARVEFAIDDPDIADYAQNAELVLGLHVRMARDGTSDPAWVPREVRFRHRAPAVTTTQQRVFRCPITFDAPDNALVIASADMRRPLRSADPGLLPILLRHADDLLAKVPVADDFPANVRRMIISALASGDATIELVSARLGMSERSVQRRLASDGESFSQLVEDARRDLSRRYLEDPSISITDAAFLVGYSDLSAFSRAFRRWMGTSAIEYRRSSLARD